MSFLTIYFLLVCPVKSRNVQKSNVQSHSKHTAQQRLLKSSSVYFDHVVLIVSTKESIATMSEIGANTAVHTLQKKKITDY